VSDYAETPQGIHADLVEQIKELDKETLRAFLSGDRAPRQILIAHYVEARDMFDEAIERLKAGE
jgi:hypothetical protein